MYAQWILGLCIVVRRRGREGGSLLTEVVILLCAFDETVVEEFLHIYQVKCRASVNDAEREVVEVETGHLCHPMDFILLQ